MPGSTGVPCRALGEASASNTSCLCMTRCRRAGRQSAAQQLQRELSHARADKQAMQGLVQQLEGDLQRTMCELTERGELAVELDEQVTVSSLGCLTTCSIMSIPGMLLPAGRSRLRGLEWCLMVEDQLKNCTERWGLPCALHLAEKTHVFAGPERPVQQPGCSL